MHRAEGAKWEVGATLRDIEDVLDHQLKRTSGKLGPSAGGAAISGVFTECHRSRPSLALMTPISRFGVLESLEYIVKRGVPSHGRGSLHYSISPHANSVH